MQRIHILHHQLQSSSILRSQIKSFVYKFHLPTPQMFDVMIRPGREGWVMKFIIFCALQSEATPSFAAVSKAHRIATSKCFSRVSSANLFIALDHAPVQAIISYSKSKICNRKWMYFWCAKPLSRNHRCDQLIYLISKLRTISTAQMLRRWSQKLSTKCRPYSTCPKKFINKTIISEAPSSLFPISNDTVLPTRCTIVPELNQAWNENPFKLLTRWRTTPIVPPSFNKYH